LSGFHAREVCIEVFQPEGQLVGIEALGAAPELAAPKRLDEALETLDLIVAGLHDACHVAQQAMQKIDVGGQVLEIEAHERV
jgi:hypothetical protein